jgi:hypothetical protein
MMGVQPFLDEWAVSERFIRELRDIRDFRSQVERYFDWKDAKHSEQITPRMKILRSSPAEERKRVYMQYRLLDQQNWYESKSQANRRLADRWFYYVVGIQFGALSFAIIQSVTGPLPLNIVSFAMTFSAGFVAWAQAKRYEDLVEPYALAAKELRTLGALIENCSDEVDVHDLIVQSELAISREHTMWCARRNIRLPK